MRLARKKSLPSLPSSLAELASLFDEGHLRRYSCCDEIMFKGCVHDVDGQATMIFACTTLLQLILSSNIEEIHVDATFKVLPSNMGNQLLTIHSMIDNYVCYFDIYNLYFNIVASYKQVIFMYTVDINCIYDKTLHYPFYKYHENKT